MKYIYISSLLLHIFNYLMDYSLSLFFFLQTRVLTYIHLFSFGFSFGLLFFFSSTFFLMKQTHRFGITGWPWVTSFHLGEKVEDMAGLGGAQSVVNWAQKMVEKTNPKGGVSRLSDE